MSGGSKSKASEGDKVQGPPTTSVQPFMPGMDQLLAGQLAAGFGGSPTSYLTGMNQYYAPMQVPDYSNYTGAPVVASSTPAPTAPVAGGIAMTDEERIRMFLPHRNGEVHPMFQGGRIGDAIGGGR